MESLNGPTDGSQMSPPVQQPPTWIPPERPQRPGPAPGIEYAGPWIRTGAYLLDGLLFVILTM
ncbi:MAG: RDD family protein [Chloroflexi bacterium]|nr:MAG: RDD family protein [Chloroflexota bacterium]